MIDRLNKQIKVYIKKEQIDKLLSLHNWDVTFLAHGEYNMNFTLWDSHHKYVFRVNMGSQLRLDHQIEYEYNALKILQESHVTPKPFYVDGSKNHFDFGILIMEFLEGNPLDYTKDLGVAANIFSRIHSLDTSHLKDDLIVEDHLFSARVKEGSWLLEDFLKSPIPDTRLKHFFSNYLDWCHKNSHKENYFLENPWMVINNTEVNSHNFIIGDRGYLIDWEKPVISHPCQDLTQFLADTTTLWRSNVLLSQDDKAFFINEYARGIHRSAEEVKYAIDLYNPYLYLRALSWCAMAWLDYQKQEKLLTNQDTLTRINQYLEFDFLEHLLKPYAILI